jgi:hypothetical protein
VTKAGAPRAARRPPSPSTFEGLAKLVLAIAIAVVGLSTAFYLPTAVERGPVAAIVIIVALLLAVALPAMALGGLLRGAAWRTEVAVIALGVMVIGGVIELMAAFSRGGTAVPFLAFAALIPLVRRPAGWRGSASTPVAALAVALGLAPYAWALVAGGLARPGSPFVVDETSLELRLEVACPADAAAAESLSATARWRWLRTEPLPAGVDAMVLTTTLVLADDTSIGYTLTSIDLPDGTFQGEGTPSAARSQELAGEGNGTAAQVAVDLWQRGMIDGAVTAHWSQRIEAVGSVTVEAAYVHGDVWTLRADAITCSWPAP